MRPVGEILLDMEVLRNELIDDHGLQLGDMMYELYGWTKIHRPDCIEVYEDDNSSPVFEYGNKDEVD